MYREEISLCRAKNNLCRAEINLCKVEISLCRTEINLCKVEISLCRTEINLCRVEISLCMAEINLCRAEIIQDSKIQDSKITPKSPKGDFCGSSNCFFRALSVSWTASSFLLAVTVVIVRQSIGLSI